MPAFKRFALRGKHVRPIGEGGFDHAHHSDPWPPLGRLDNDWLFLYWAIRA